MGNTWPHILIAVVPLIITSILHMVVVKKGLFRVLNTPLSMQAFGRNKTWRGFVFVPLINSLVFVLLNLVFPAHFTASPLLGFVLGLAYMVAELPNSFVKRRVGIESGQSHKKHHILFSLMDKSDSAFGVSFVYYLLENISVEEAVLLFIIGSLVHIGFSFLLVAIKLKSRF